MNKYPEIELTRSEMWYGGMVGVMRHVRALSYAGLNNQDKASYGWQNDCDGACGEKALAKRLDRYWDGTIGIFDAKDVGKLQARTASKPDGDLVVRTSDINADIFILVLSYRAPVFVFRGWMSAKDAKQDKYWDNPGYNRKPAWFVPQADLNDMEHILRNYVCP